MFRSRSGHRFCNKLFLIMYEFQMHTDTNTQALTSLDLQVGLTREPQQTQAAPTRWALQPSPRRFIGKQGGQAMAHPPNRAAGPNWLSLIHDQETVRSRALKHC